MGKSDQPIIFLIHHRCGRSPVWCGRRNTRGGYAERPERAGAVVTTLRNEWSAPAFARPLSLCRSVSIDLYNQRRTEGAETLISRPAARPAENQKSPDRFCTAGEFR
jgi:hypothetical protein